MSASNRPASRLASDGPDFADALHLLASRCCSKKQLAVQISIHKVPV